MWPFNKQEDQYPEFQFSKLRITSESPHSPKQIIDLLLESNVIKREVTHDDVIRFGRKFVYDIETDSNNTKNIVYDSLFILFIDIDCSLSELYKKSKSIYMFKYNNLRFTLKSDKGHLYLNFTKGAFNYSVIKPFFKDHAVIKITNLQGEEETYRPLTVEEKEPESIKRQ
jgi:hypothetical protein